MSTVLQYLLGWKESHVVISTKMNADFWYNINGIIKITIFQTGVKAFNLNIGCQ